MKIKIRVSNTEIKEVNAQYKIAVDISGESHDFALNTVRMTRERSITHLLTGRVFCYLGIVDNLPAKKMRVQMIKRINETIQQHGDKRILQTIKSALPV